VTVYNSEKYLRQCLDSILSQNTNYEYEVIVGDDASSDSSASIVAEYAYKYPCKIVAILRKANIGGSANFVDLVRRAQGKFLVFSDGDDYWTNVNKLQLQYEYLKKNETRFAVAHQVSVQGHMENSLRFLEESAQSSTEISINKFIRGSKFGLTSVMLRNDTDTINSILELILKGPRNAGDTVLCMFILSKSPIEILPSFFSVYRCRAAPGESNYNSITNMYAKLRDKLLLIELSDFEYGGKYLVTPMYTRLLKTVMAASFRKKLTIGEMGSLCVSIILALLNSYYRYLKACLAKLCSSAPHAA
jgi:glycosyltransferase involved in cell wall biosynthesis